MLLKGHVRLWGSPLPLVGSCCCNLPFFSVTGPIPPFCVCCWGSFRLFDQGCAWAKLSKSFSVSWHFAALSPCPAAQPPAPGGPAQGTPFTGRCPVPTGCPCPRRQVSAPLQPSEVSTAASPFSSSLWVVASATISVGGSDPSANAAARVSRQEKTRGSLEEDLLLVKLTCNHSYLSH